MTKADEPQSGNRFDLHAAFRAKQHALEAALKVPYGFTDHGTTIGSALEVNWVGMLQEFLPRRYGISKGFVIDSRGAQSEQIDALVFDQQYSPLFFEAPDGTLIVPAEAVYAAFEVKPEINKEQAKYAGNKVASVRRLHRTSVETRHAGGYYEPRDPADFPIIGGLLASRSSWKSMQGPAARRALLSFCDEHRIEIGCVLDSISFDLASDDSIDFSPSEAQLVFFAMRLFRRLQRLGTVLTIDISAYEAALGSTHSD